MLRVRLKKRILLYTSTHWKHIKKISWAWDRHAIGDNLTINNVVSILLMSSAKKMGIYYRIWQITLILRKINNNHFKTDFFFNFVSFPSLSAFCWWVTRPFPFMASRAKNHFVTRINQVKKKNIKAINLMQYIFFLKMPN